MFGALLLTALWAFGFHRFVEALPAAAAQIERETDAIIVLTGGSRRLAEGLGLLVAGRAQKLFVSGVYRGVDVAELLRVTERSGDALSGRIALGHAADDTRGNARESGAWMAAERYASLRLVTAAYHMPRSLLEFRRVMPSVDIIAHPVFPSAVQMDAWWRHPATASLLAAEYCKFLVALGRDRLSAAVRDVSARAGSVIG